MTYKTEQIDEGYPVGKQNRRNAQDADRRKMSVSGRSVLRMDEVELSRAEQARPHKSSKRKKRSKSRRKGGD